MKLIYSQLFWVLVIYQNSIFISSDSLSPTCEPSTEPAYSPTYSPSTVIPSTEPSKVTVKL